MERMASTGASGPWRVQPQLGRSLALGCFLIAEFPEFGLRGGATELERVHFPLA